MCEPTMIALGLTSALTAATSIVGAQRSSALQTARAEQANQIAARNNAIEVASRSLQQQQQTARTAEAAKANTIAAERAAGQARAAFAGANVGGGALGAAVREFQRQGAAATGQALSGLRFAAGGSELGRLGDFQRTVVSTSANNPPGQFGALDIATGGLAGAQTFLQGGGLSLIRKPKP